MGNDQDDTVVVPPHTLQRRVTGNLKVATLLVSMQDDSDSTRLKEVCGNCCTSATSWLAVLAS